MQPTSTSLAARLTDNDIKPVMDTSGIESEAAQKIQSLWRGHNVRKKYRKPEFRPCNEKSLIKPSGNDPISHAETFLEKGDHCAIVATGGLQCLSNALRITQKTGKKPKIFLMDYSKYAEKFWAKIREAMKNSHDISSFLKKIPPYQPDDSQDLSVTPANANAQKRRAATPATGEQSCGGKKRKTESLVFPGKHKRLPAGDTSNPAAWGMKRQCSPEISTEYLNQREVQPDKYFPLTFKPFLQNMFGSDEDNFKIVKATIQNHFLFINHDWSRTVARKNFKFIRYICDHHGYKVLAYPSNIEDCFNRNKTLGRRTKVLQRNIDILSPAITIKTCQAKPRSCGLFPDTTIYRFEDSKNTITETTLINPPARFAPTT